METETFGAVAETIVFGVLLVFPLWVILKKAGFHPALSLLIFIPAFGFLIILMILGLGTWQMREGDG